MKRLWLPVFILIALLLTALGVYWLGTPRLNEYSPSAAAQDLPASTSLRLTFTRPMEADSVKAKLSIEPNLPGTFNWQGNTLTYTPVKSWPAGTTVRVMLEKGARAAGLLNLGTNRDSVWQFTIRQPRLAYLYPADGAANLYLVNPLSGESQQLTDSLAGVLEFDVNPGGNVFYYSAGNGLGGSDLYRLEQKEGKAAPTNQVLVECGQAQCRAPRLSPGEDFLAYERSEPSGSDGPVYPRVWYLPLAKETAIKGTPEPAIAGQPQLAGDPIHQTILPDWSGNGWLSFYDTLEKAFMFKNLTSGAETSFSNQTGEAGSWAPEGEFFVAPEISFNIGGSSENTPELKPLASSHLMRFSPQNGEAFDLTAAENLEDTAPAFSPDSAYLAFARKYLDINRWTPGRQLWLMRSDGSDQRPLTDDPNYTHYDAAWSPEGDQIAVVRFNQTSLIESPEIWLVNPQTGQTFQLLVNGYAPHWIP